MQQHAMQPARLRQTPGASQHHDFMRVMHVHAHARAHACFLLLLFFFLFISSK
jgi:hypothetical protein